MGGGGGGREGEREGRCHRRLPCHPPTQPPIAPPRPAQLPSTAVGTVEFRSLLEPIRVANPFVTFCEVCNNMGLARKEGDGRQVPPQHTHPHTTPAPLPLPPHPASPGHLHRD